MKPLAPIVIAAALAVGACGDGVSSADAAGETTSTIGSVGVSTAAPTTDAAPATASSIPAELLNTSRFETTVAIDGEVVLSASGAIDLDNELMEFSANSAQMILGPGFETDPIDAVFDFSNDVVYVMIDGRDTGTTAPWVVVDLAFIAGASDTTVDELRDELIGSIGPQPYDWSDFTELENARHLGSEIIDGDRYDHYRIGGDLAEIAEQVPELGELAGVELEAVGDVVVDVWLTADGQGRRIKVTFQMDGAAVVSDMNVLSIGAPIVIELPPPDEVVALADLGGDDPMEGEFGPVTITGASLPTYAADAADPAVGLPAPEVRGVDFNDVTVEIENDGVPKVVLFLAHWCPHCQAEVGLVQAWLDAGGGVEGVELVSVATGMNETRPNWPTSAWLRREGWTVPVIRDGPDYEVFYAYGGNAFPFYTFIDTNGDVAVRAAGRLSTDDLQALMETIAP